MTLINFESRLCGLQHWIYERILSLCLLSYALKSLLRRCRWTTSSIHRHDARQALMAAAPSCQHISFTVSLHHSIIICWSTAHCALITLLTRPTVRQTSEYHVSSSAVNWRSAHTQCIVNVTPWHGPIQVLWRRFVRGLEVLQWGPWT